MNFEFNSEDENFRSEVSVWLEYKLSGEFESIRYRGGPGDENAYINERKQWERVLGKSGWIGIG